MRDRQTRLSSLVHRSTFIVCLALLFVAPSISNARDAREQARIDFLLHTVEASTSLKFIRNGTEHDGPAAAAHLRSKLSLAGGRVATAEDFVKYCASESSMTHQKYKVRQPDGTVVDAAAYFHAELRKFDEKK